MKNKIAIIIVFLTLSNLSNAQFYLGAKVGLNFANVSGNVAYTTFNSKIGINGGATAKYNFMNHLGAQMDILYSQMGTKGSLVTIVDDGAGTTIKTEQETIYNDSYVQVPLFINWELPIKQDKLIPYRVSGSIASVHLFGGGFFGYGIGNTESTTGKITTTSGGATTTESLAKTSGSNKYFSAIDFGIMFGAGFSFKLSDKGKLTIDGRYLMGLASTSSNVKFYPDLKNMAPQVQLGYIHRISKLKRWQILD